MEPVDEDCVGRAVGTPEETLQQYEELAFRNGSSCRISMELNTRMCPGASEEGASPGIHINFFL